MKSVKKSVIIFGAVAIALLMVLTVTAVPQVQSKSVSKLTKRSEQIKTLLTTKKEILSKQLSNIKKIDLNALKDKITNILSKLNIKGSSRYYDPAKPCLIPLLPIIIVLLPFIISLIMIFPQLIPILIALAPIGLPLPIIFRLAEQLQSNIEA